MIALMKRFAAAAVLGALAFPAEAATAPPACAPGKAASSRLASVADGTTLTLEDGRMIALAGIDPPLPALGPPGADAALVEAATKAVSAAIGDRPVKVALVDAKPDRYGRFRANV